MDSKISLNGEPLIWITVDETYDPASSECHWVARRSDFRDYLIPLSGGCLHGCVMHHQPMR